MADQDQKARRNQARLFIIIFAALVAALGAGYLLLLRTDYVILYSELRDNEAAAIVTELDRRGVSYRLGQGGTAILVPAAEADALRIGMAGTDLPTNGEVGFEVFNESSMGLTDFAQKINYQRALQGELSRTIMSMEGVESARVHLALPERALFRGSRGESRAAVTIIPKRGHFMDEPRVVGIQRLVASSVPDLPLANVIVLDGFGRIISATGFPGADAAPVPELEPERQRYQAQIREVLSRSAPAISFEVELTLVPDASPSPDASSIVTGAQTGRAFKLRVALLSQTPVSADDQARIAAALREAAVLDESTGDSLSFRTAMPAAAPSAPLPAASALPVPAPSPAAGTVWSFVTDNWFALLMSVGIVSLLALSFLRSATTWRRQRSDLVARIRAHLSGTGAPHGG